MMKENEEMNEGNFNLPSAFDDFSLCACANAFVCSNKSSWNCFESVVVDKSTDLRLLKEGKKYKKK